MNNLNCKSCERELNKSEINKKASVCHRCISKSRVERIQTEVFLKENFRNKWCANLFKEYVQYLEQLQISADVIRKHTSKVLKILIMAENDLFKPTDITEKWIVNALEKLPNSKGVKSSLFQFLIQKGLLKLNQDDEVILGLKRQLEEVTKGFKRLLEIYFNERMEVRKRQVKFNARKPLSLRTVRADVDVYIKLIKWFETRSKRIESWDTVQQEDIHEYLLTLTPKHREIVRKDLLVLFKLAKRKRIITHIPILDIKTRELPPTVEPLCFEEQVKVAKIIKYNCYERPLESLLTSLCFYHGLSSSHIRNIKLTDLNLDKKVVFFIERPPVYLSDDEMIMVNKYAKLRSNIRNVENKSYLFLSSSASHIYQDRPINNSFIASKVKGLTNFTPKSLRITCFNTIASHFGPQLLVEGFGVSLTQASRYGKLEDYLIEEQIQHGRMDIID